MASPKQKKNQPTVWVCTSGTDYEDSGVDAVYADVHGARSWLARERRKRISLARKTERESAKLEDRKPDYLGIPNSPIYTEIDSAGGEGFMFGDQWWRITPWKVAP